MALVQAAQQLTREVEALGGSVEVLDGVDGLGFSREVRIDSAGVKALGEVAMEVLADDDRVSEVVRSNKGAKVVFVSDVRADYAQPFDLAEAVEVTES